MTLSTINVGLIGNDGTGDTLRDAGVKINDNFATVESAILPLWNVKQFDAVGDDAADDTAEVQAALDAVGVDGGTLLLNNGTYRVSALSMPSNVRLLGESRNAVIKSIAGTSQSFIVIDGKENVTIEGVTFDMNNNPANDTNGAVCIKLETTSAAVNNTTIKGCKFINGVIRPFIDIRNSIASTGVYVTDNEFYGQSALIAKTAPAVQNTPAIRMLSTAGVVDSRFDHNLFKYISIAVQVRPQPTPQTFDFFTNLSCSHNVVTGVLDDPNVGATPVEVFGVTNLTIVGNRLDSGGRGVSALFVKNGVYTGNSFLNQTIYCMEVQSADGITVTGNTALNCKTFINVTGASGAPGTTNVNIAGNLIKGGNLGIPGYNTTSTASTITMIATAATGNANWNISDNLFVDVLHTGQVSGGVALGSIIRINNPLSTNIRIAGNQFLATQEEMTVNCINISAGSNVDVTENTIVRTSDVSTSTYSSSTSAIPFIQITAGSSYVKVKNNFIRFSGAVTIGGHPGVIGIGSFAAAGTLAGSAIERNTLVGGFYYSLYLQYTSADLVVADNNLDGATGLTLYNAAIVYRRNRRRVNAAAAPTTGTWSVGDMAFNSAPAVGQPIGWACTVAGTPGTWVAMANL